MSHLRKGLQRGKNIRHKKSKKEISKPLFLWPHSADQFEKKLKEFGYIGDDEGVCHGVACVAAHAMLLNQIDQFDHDLLRIRDSTPVADDQNQYKDRAFLEAVELCHQPSKYSHLFPIYYEKSARVKVAQHPLNSIPLIESKVISAQGGVIVAAKFSGVYDRSDLIACLKLIRTGIEKFPHPMSLLLSDDCHILAVQYNPAEQVWIFVDTNSLPSRKYHAEETLARAISNALTPSLKKTVISGMILATRQNEAVAKKAFAYTARLRQWKKIQGIDETKMRYLKRWFFIAANDGCEKEVAFLLTHQLNPNQPNLRGDTPLTTAAYQGNEGVVRLLLSHGARVNEKRKHIKSPLYSAMLVGNDSIINLLRAAGAQLKKDECQELGLSVD